MVEIAVRFSALMEEILPLAVSCPLHVSITYFDQALLAFNKQPPAGAKTPAHRPAPKTKPKNPQPKRVSG